VNWNSEYFDLNPGNVFVYMYLPSKALEAAISEYNTEMLRRGVAAVKVSRGEHPAQKNIAKENGKSTVRISQHVRHLPEKEVVLKILNTENGGEGTAISSAVPAPVASLKA